MIDIVTESKTTYALFLKNDPLLREIEKRRQHSEKASVLMVFKALLGQKKYQVWVTPQWLYGIAVGFTSGYLYKLVKLTIPNATPEEVDSKTGMVLLTMSVF